MMNEDDGLGGLAFVICLLHVSFFYSHPGQEPPCPVLWQTPGPSLPQQKDAVSYCMLLLPARATYLSQQLLERVILARHWESSCSYLCGPQYLLILKSGVDAGDSVLETLVRVSVTSLSPEPSAAKPITFATARHLVPHQDASRWRESCGRSGHRGLCPSRLHHIMILLLIGILNCVFSGLCYTVLLDFHDTFDSV